MRVVIADELPIYLSGLVSVLSSENGFSVVGLASTPEEAIALAEQHAPDLLILGLDIATKGLKVASEARRRTPRARIVFITLSQRQEDITAALQLGAAAYILRSISGSDLLQTLRMVMRGETYITPSLAVRLLSPRQSQEIAGQFDLCLLTVREREILSELALARTNKEIARKLNLTEKTVKYYMGRMMQKLSARNRTEVAMRARELNVAAE